MRKSLPCRGISWQPFTMFDIVFTQLGVIPRIMNKFVEIIAVAERSFVTAHLKNEEWEKHPFSLWLPVKVADGRMSVKKGKNYCT